MTTCSHISLFSLFASVKYSLVLSYFGDEVSLKAAFLRRFPGEWKMVNGIVRMAKSRGVALGLEWGR